MNPLVTLENCLVSRAGQRLLGPVAWQLEAGHHVALVGLNGAGKTTLLRLLRGDLLPDAGGVRTYDFGDGPQSTVLGLRQRMGLVSADMQDFYFLHTRRTSGRTVVLSGWFDTPLLYEEPSSEQMAAADEIIAFLGIEDLVDSVIGTLSTGQVRKLLIARALVSSPDVLLLDECLEGLDAASRGEVLALLEKGAERTTLVCAVHRRGDVPRGVNRGVALESGTIVFEGGLDEAFSSLRGGTSVHDRAALPVVARPDTYPYLLRMEHVSVVSDGVRFLHDVSWEIHPGDVWLVLGENGAGKSTLIKLILSETAPYADDEQGVGTIERLGGMTMDEARPRLGVVSPALQTSYARELGWDVTALETVLSGYRGSVGMLDEPTDEELAGAYAWLDFIGLSELAETPLRRMSYGQQRRVFLARAMAPGPALLLLDEPLAGLDRAAHGDMLALIQSLAESGTPMVLVTHHVEDRIPAINRVLVMHEGRQVFCGTRDEYEMSQVMG